MRFTTAWADVLSQNQTLRIVILSLTLCLTGLMIGFLYLSNQPPLFIERSCYNEAIAPKIASVPTESELKAFLMMAISMRFDTEATPSRDFLSQNELEFRNTEQEKLTSQDIKQKVILEKIEISDKLIKVDLDKLLMTKNIRSAFLMPISVEVAQTTRSKENPYGLVLMNVKPLPTTQSP